MADDSGGPWYFRVPNSLGKPNRHLRHALWAWDTCIRSLRLEVEEADASADATHDFPSDIRWVSTELYSFWKSFSQVEDEFVATCNSLVEWRGRRGTSMHRIVGQELQAKFDSAISIIVLATGKQPEDGVTIDWSYVPDAAIDPESAGLPRKTMHRVVTGEEVFTDDEIRSSCRELYDELIICGRAEFARREAEIALKRELCCAHDRRFVTGRRQVGDDQPNESEDPSKKEYWWFQDEPPADSSFDGNGPIEASLKQLAGLLDVAEGTLKKNNGASWWIQRVHRTSYRCWFTSRARFAGVNQKAISDSQTTPNVAK